MELKKESLLKKIRIASGKFQTKTDQNQALCVLTVHLDPLYKMWNKRQINHNLILKHPTLKVA